jgi:hypothetical protein
MNHASNLVYRARHEQPQNDLLSTRALTSSQSPSSGLPSTQQQQRQFKVKRQRHKTSCSFLKASSRRNVLVFLIILLAFSMMVALLLFSTSTSRTTPVRNMRAIHKTSQHPSVVRLDILERDGRMPPPAPTIIRSVNIMPSYGKLQMSFSLEERRGGRRGGGDTIAGIRREIITHDDPQSSGVHAAKKNQSSAADEEYVGSYYAFDDDYLRNPYQRWEDDTVKEKRTCRRVSWHRYARSFVVKNAVASG